MKKNSGDAYIYFDKNTDFSGEIESSRIILEGRIDGVVHAEKAIHLKKGSFIKGEIHTGHLIADEGSTCLGELQVNYSNGKNGQTAEKENGGTKKNFRAKVASMITSL